MKKELRMIVRSCRAAMMGLRHAYQLDKSFRMEVRYGLPIYLVVGWILAPFTPWEFLIYIFSYILIVIVELFNTAIEKMLDRLHPEEHELIGKSKDIASAPALLAFLFAIIVILTLSYVRFTHTQTSLMNSFVLHVASYADLA